MERMQRAGRLYGEDEVEIKDRMKRIKKKLRLD